MRRVWFLPMAVALILVICGNVAPAFAAAAKEPDPEQRIGNQQKRIDQALQAKEINTDDAKPLQGGLDKIKEEMARMKADGQLSKEEKDKLNTLLDQNGELINKTRQAKKSAPAAPAKAATTVAPAKPAATAVEKGAKPAPAKPTITPAPAPPKIVTPAAQDPNIQKAITDQRSKIDQGIKSKQLALGESKVLEDNLGHIREEDVRLRADGALTQTEKDQLLKLLDQNNKMIQDKKANPVMNMRESIDLKDRSRTIPERFERQQGRIDRGIKSKELTKEEAKILQDNLNYVKNEEARLRADGKLSDQERNRLHNMLDQNSDMIENKKNNPVKRVN